MPNDSQNLNPFSQDTASLDSTLTSGNTSLPPQTQQTSPLNMPAADDTAAPLGGVGSSPSAQPQNLSTQNPSVLNPIPPNTTGGATPPSDGQGPQDASTITTSTHVPKKYGGKKVIATIFSVLFIVGAVAAGVFLVQQQQDLREQAASGSACQQSPDCVLVDNAPNSGSRTVDRTIIYVDITDQDYHRYNPGNTDDGCRRVNISGNTVTWEKYGSGSECKDVSNVQIWMGNVLSPTTPPTSTLTPTPVTSATVTPSGNNPVSCPSGTEPLFSKLGDMHVGDSTAVGGSISSLNGDWDVETQNGVKLAQGGSKITVSFPSNVNLESVLIYDNDPKSGENPWSINGTSLPTTPNNTWGPLFNLNKTSNQMVFDNGGDSPHFNVCVKTAQTTTVPTVPPGVTAQCNAVKAYDMQGNLLTQSQLSQLTAGDKVRFAVSGTTSSGSFDKARFTVNNVLIGESTNKNTNNEYYLDYEIPQSATTFNVKGEVHHSSLGWI